LKGSLSLRLGQQRSEIRLDEGVAWIEGRKVAFRAVRREGELVAIELAGASHAVRVARQGGRAFVWCEGADFEFERSSPLRRTGAGEHEGDLVSPMPGRIRRAFVAPGERVEKGQVLMVLEAMKMEHAIRAPREGVVSRLPHAEGELVEAGVVLVEMGGLDTASEIALEAWDSGES
jgi:3-methylcrotonyl-CoA carboxylase alpha subunit